MVGLLLAPQPQDLGCSAGEASGGHRCLTYEFAKINNETNGHGLVRLPAGTDTWRYRVPPDGNGRLRGPSGTDERSFHRPPDWGWDRWSMGTTGWDLEYQRELSGVTDVRQFCRPPDPGLGDVRGVDLAGRCEGSGPRQTGSGGK